MLRAIVDQARQGDEEAFGALVREVGDRCIFIAHRILRDANLAEDAVQVALVQVWRELPALRDLDRFEAWLHRILVNACYAEARRGRHFAADVVLLETDAPTADDDELLTVHDRDQLDRGFRRLSAGAARRPRLPLRPRADRARGRRSPRHPPRDGEVPTVLRDRGDPGGARSRRPDADPRPGAAGMTTPRDPDALLAAYLADGMEVLPDRVVDSVLDEVHRTRQRPCPWPARRTRPMSRTTLAAAAVVAAVAVGGAFFVIQRGLPEIAAPSPTPSTQPSPSLPAVVAPSSAPERQRRPRPRSRERRASGSPPGRWARLALATPRCGSSMAGCSWWAAPTATRRTTPPRSCTTRTAGPGPPPGTWSGPVVASRSRPRCCATARCSWGMARGAEVYDPDSGTWTVTGKMARSTLTGRATGARPRCCATAGCSWSTTAAAPRSTTPTAGPGPPRGS